jgi:hypothetical protein
MAVSVAQNDTQFWISWSRQAVAISAKVSIVGVVSTVSVEVATILRLPSINMNTTKIAKEDGAVFDITGTGFIPGQTSFSWSPSFSGIDCTTQSSTFISCVVHTIIVGPLYATATVVDGASASVQIGVAVEAVVVPVVRANYVSASQSPIQIVIQNLLGNSTRPSAVLRIDSGSKRAVSDVPCLPEDASSTSPFINCVPASALTPGSLEILVNAYGYASISQGYGYITPSAVVTQSLTTYASSGPYELTIKGSYFGSLNAGQSTSVLFAPNVPVSFNASRWDNNTIIVSFTSPAPLGNLTATVTANGGPSAPAVVAYIVPNPTVTPTPTFVISTATTVTITGANFNPAYAQNDVILSKAGTSEEFPCVPAASSTATSIVCNNLNLTSFTSTTTLLAKVRAFNSYYSSPTQVANVGPEAPPVEGGNGIANQQLAPGAIGGIIAGVAAGIILFVIIAILIARRRFRTAAKAQEEKIRKEIEHKLKEMQMEMKDVFNLKASDLTITTKLGEGSYGAVFLALFKKRHVAVKKLASSVMGDQVSEFFREAALMLSLKDHPNVGTWQMRRQSAVPP